jgi:hypothetical protein
MRVDRGPRILTPDRVTHRPHMRRRAEGGPAYVGEAVGTRQ